MLGHVKSFKGGDRGPGEKLKASPGSPLGKGFKGLHVAACRRGLVPEEVIDLVGQWKNGKVVIREGVYSRMDKDR